MGAYFLDSSALVKRYLSETGSAWVRALFASPDDNKVLIAEVTPVEVIAAVARRARAGDIPRADAADVSRRVRTDAATSYQLVDLTGAVIDRAMTLAETGRMRGYDAIQLASAMEVNSAAVSSGMSSITFVSADDELNAMAASQGLVVENPNAHP